MINARKKGHAYEREIARRFREAGFADCVTSRLESKRLDDLGVDLCHTGPWLVQCKAVERLGCLHTILSNMPEGGVPVVFHKKNRRGTIVALREEDFWEIVRSVSPPK